jgi:hypothetical protein
LCCTTASKADTEEGLSATDKQRRLDQLRAAIVRTGARRKLALREVEIEGEHPAGVNNPLFFPLPARDQRGTSKAYGWESPSYGPALSHRAVRWT